MSIECKMDANENPYPLPERIQNKITGIIDDFDFNRYPDSHSVKLREKLAEYIGYPSDNILVGNGSDELLSLIITGLMEDNKKLVFPVPTFKMYQFYADIMGYDTDKISLDSNFNPDWEEIMSRTMDNDVGMFIFCFPNNPTGNLFSLKKIEEVISTTDKPVLIDEAYAEFASRSGLEFLEKYQNVIILRTFSKAFALASLRIGYMIANPPLLEKVEAVRSPYNVDSFSQKLACLALEERESYQEYWQEIKNKRERLKNNLNRIEGVTSYPSQTNFILFNTSLPEKKVFEGLKEKGIKIRYFSELPCCGDVLRVSVGLDKENQKFLKVLKTVLRGD